MLKFFIPIGGLGRPIETPPCVEISSRDSTLSPESFLSRKVTEVRIGFIGILLGLLANGQPIRGSRKVVPAVSAYSLFVPSADTVRLPKSYLGFDIAQISTYLGFSAFAKPKSDFETNSQYAARQQPSLDTEVMPGLRLSSPMTFTLQPVPETDDTLASLSPATLKYDAEKHSLNVSLHFVTAFKTEEQELYVREVSHSIGSYPASNAFGAKINVPIVFNQEYYLILPSASWVTPGAGDASGQRTFSVSVDMDPVFAQKAFDHIGVIMIVRLRAPWFTTTNQHITPTLSDPVSEDRDDNYLYVSPEEVDIFNLATGQILKRVSNADIEPVHADLVQSTVATSNVAIQEDPVSSSLPKKSAPSDSPKPTAVQVSEKRTLVRNVEAYYPPLAKAAKIEGDVVFTVFINGNGDIQEMRLVSGHPLLVNAAREAVLQWKYNPIPQKNRVDTTDVVVSFHRYSKQ